MSKAEREAIAAAVSQLPDHKLDFVLGYVAGVSSCVKPEDSADNDGGDDEKPQKTA